MSDNKDFKRSDKSNSNHTKQYKYTQKEIMSILVKNFAEIDYVGYNDIPDIDLYIDQVTSFIDSHLESVKRNADDKTLTKTMINNYTKNNVLPSPNKKKYSKNHILTLIFIYYLKTFLSIKDVKAIMEPVTDKFFNSDDDMAFTDIYKEIVDIELADGKPLTKDVLRKFNLSQKAFQDAPEEDREMLQRFAFICLLAYDIYVKKMMIEELIDLDALNDGDDDTSAD